MKRLASRKLHASMGFTLVEMLVATAIVGTTLVGMFQAFAWAASIQRLTRQTALANQIASQELELLRSLPFSSLPSNQTNGAFYGTVLGLERLPQGQGLLTIANYNPDGKLKTIAITVRWHPGSLTKEVHLDTLAGQGGIQQ